MIKTQVVFEGKNHAVSFFEDDTINIVRQQISKSIDIHPDRLFILVGIELSRNFYTQDSRNWEMLFNRLSMNGQPIEKEPFNAYCSQLRSDNPLVQYSKIDKDEWMSKPDLLQRLYDPGGEFTEYRIFGTEPDKAYCLPFEFDSASSSRIPSAQYPVPEEGRLVSSLYNPEKIQKFIVREYSDGEEGPYFPLYRSVTPQRLSADQIRNLEENAKHLQDLLKLDPPAPKQVHILRASWKADLVETEFGDATRTRFEQIFYGITLSPEVPCISFYTGRSEVSRHKFYKTSAKTREPLLDIPMWSSWWAKSKPARDRLPTLVLYRGESRYIFDRIFLTPNDIIFAVYRDQTNKKPLETMKEDMLKWFRTFDAIVPFIQSSDLAESRIVLQDIKFEAEYSNSLDEFNTLRLGCVSGIFEESRAKKEFFRFLRSDDANDGINPRDLRVINLLREDPFLKVSDVEEELKLSQEDAKKLLDTIVQRIEDQPNLINRQFRNHPIMEIKQKSIEVSSVDSVDRFLKYANILRYILSDPSSKELDRLCPKKLETSEAVVSVPQTASEDSEFGDLFGYLEGMPEEKEPEKKEYRGKTEKSYKYFYDRLQEFDSDTFHPSSTYPKVCEKSHQPVILSDKEIADIVGDVKKGEDYNPKNYPDDKKLNWKNPDGVVVCPEYWCMYDKIPILETQLEEVDGAKVCPVCHGKIQDADMKLDAREYPVIRRDKRQIYPKLKDEKSPKNGKQFPCCYKTPKQRKLVTDEKEQKYYVLSEDKSGLGSLRFAYLPSSLIGSLFLDETYSSIIDSGNRIQSGMSGFFRLGMKYPADDLPILLNSTKIVQSPRKSVKTILRCSFLASWPDQSDDNLKEIEEALTMKPFSDDETAKKHVARIISSIDTAFVNKTLTPSQSLEYTALSLKIDLFKINLTDNSISCSFYTQQVKVNSKGIVVLQHGTDIDCLSYITRQQRAFVYRTNIFEAPFKEETYNELYKQRNKACKTEIPTFSDAVLFMQEIGEPNFSVILDPYGRAQAIYVPNEIVLPFQNTTIPPITKPLISGYSNIRELPSYSDMRDILTRAQKIAHGYEWAEDIFDGKGSRTEILTRSGLRLPVKPESGSGQDAGIIDTVTKQGETELVFGNENEEDLQKYKNITYASELYEFLIFQLTKDIQKSSKLREVLSAQTPSTDEVQPLLEKWFDDVTHFVSLRSPIEFLSKIRKPCGQFTNKDVCQSGHMCAWNPKAGQCRIQVRDTISKKNLFNKLLGTLVDNSKIRSIVLDGRTTPFFSTVLYLELPNEIIFTDAELKSEPI
jgi:hypothetical protein